MVRQRSLKLALPLDGRRTFVFGTSSARGLLVRPESPSEPQSAKEAIGAVLSEPRSISPKAVERLMQYYSNCSKEERTLFFKVMSLDFGAQTRQVNKAVENWQKVWAPGNEVEEVSDNSIADWKMLNQKIQEMHAVTTPRYRQLFPPIAKLPQGVKFLVGMRADALQAAAREPSTTEGCREVSLHLKYALEMCFSLGSLELRRITWEKSNDTALQSIIAAESVHKIRGQEDLKRRLDHDRRCYTFFHPAMPEDPLVLLSIALLPEVACNVQHILDAPPARCAPAWGDTKCAIFYSINSTQRGLAGIDLGGLMIKQAALRLQQELGPIQIFSTLSPIPNFRSWLLSLLQAKSSLPAAAGTNAGPHLFHPHERIMLMGLASTLHIEGLPKENSSRDSKCPNASEQAAARTLHAVLETGSNIDKDQVAAIVLRLCARYVARERRKAYALLDPVANFHCRNGAEIWRLNWQADSSPQGQSNSYGIMANYMYDLEELEANSRDYITRGTVAMSDQLCAISSHPASDIMAKL